MNQLINMTSKSGKYIYSAVLIAFGLFHLTGADKMAGAVPVPGGVFWVYFTGLCLLAGAVGIITNLKGLGKPAAFLSGVLILVFAFGVQFRGFINADNEMAKMMSMAIFLKDMAIAAGAWVIAGTFKD